MMRSVVLAPLLFLPLVSFRRFAPALPCLALAMIADRAVQQAAEVGVLNLSPVAAHMSQMPLKVISCM